MSLLILYACVKFGHKKRWYDNNHTTERKIIQVKMQLRTLFLIRKTAKRMMTIPALILKSHLLYAQYLCNNSTDFVSHSIKSKVVRMATIAGS